MNSRIGLLLFGIAMFVVILSVTAMVILVRGFGGPNGSEDLREHAEFWAVIFLAQMASTYLVWGEPLKKHSKIIFLVIGAIIQIILLVPVIKVGFELVEWKIFVIPTVFLVLLVVRAMALKRLPG